MNNWCHERDGQIGVWRAWARHVTGEAMSGGHFFPGVHPDLVAARLAAFFAASLRQMRKLAPLQNPDLEAGRTALNATHSRRQAAKVRQRYARSLTDRDFDPATSERLKLAALGPGGAPKRQLGIPFSPRIAGLERRPPRMRPPAR